MPTYRVPLLVWKDFEGAYSAAIVEPGLAEPGMVGVAESASDAIGQVQAYLEWWYKNCSWQGAPDFLAPELISLRVSVRPQYQEGERIYPCKEEIELQVPCVHGHQECGLLLCAMPTLGLGFHFYQEDELRRMATETVRQTVAHNSPQQLARLLPPASVRLELATIRVPSSRTAPATSEGPPTLLRIAQAIGQPNYRKRFSAAWQREREVADLIRRIGQEKANVVLLGPRGAGKTSVLVNAVRSLERTRSSEAIDDASSVPFRYRYWQTNAGRLIAGMRYLGEWQQRCEQLIDELSSIDGTLVVESLLDLLRLGGEGPGGSLAAFFLPFLHSGQLRLVAEATPEEFDACRRLLPGFADVFQVLRLRELSAQEARAALDAVVDLHVRDTKTAVDEQCGHTLFRLFRRFMPYRPLPGAAVGFLKHLFDQAKERQLERIPVARVVEQFVRETGLPEPLLRDDMPMDIDDLEQAFQRQILGQETPCRAMAEVVATFKAGLNDPRRPLGTFLFCGPTGVGKTQLAKTISTYLFGHGQHADRLIRLDMSEYSSPYAAERLITKDDGTPSEFLSRVRRQPFVVVLFDEIEKAADEVFDVLLGVLDEGRLTDRFGRTTTFQSAILILTSNLGATQQSVIGLRPHPSERYEAEVRSFFRPEFFNRIDAMVTFQPLDRETCLAITRKELHEISRREGFTKAGLRLTFSDQLVQQLTEEGFDPRYGARPLQRTLETRVVAGISRFLIERSGLHGRLLQLDVGPQQGISITVVEEA